MRVGSDVDWFVECCVGGVLYDYLVDRAGHDGLTFHSFLHPRKRVRIADRPVCRKDVKRAFVVMMFANPATTRRIALYETFTRHFPAVSRYMDEVKEGGYQKLAHECQRMESRLMIDTALADLMVAEPAAPVFSVHDSIATTPEYVDAVVGAINNAFEPFGIAPPIHRTEYV